jgi:phage FluMu gp28-like protein
MYHETPNETEEGAMATKEEIRAALDAAQSRQEAGEYLDSLGLTKDGLTAVAGDLGCSMYYDRTKADIRRRIIEHTAGARLDAKAIRGASW